MLKDISKYYWWCQIGGWLFWMLLNILLANYYNRPMDGIFFLDQGSLVIIGIGLTHALRWCIIRWKLLEYPLHKLIFRIPILIIVCAVLLTLIRGYELANLYPDHHRHLFSLWRFTTGALMITTWTTIYYMGFYFQKEQQYQMDKFQLETMVKDLELRTIKSQLNPHFLFNALNSIRALVDENPERARTAITELSNILRASIKTEKLETVTMYRELRIVKDYLAVEHIRFEERMEVEYDIHEDTLDLRVPPMMLQTLVENAIKHGIAHTVAQGKVSIISKKTAQYHQIIVQNSGQLLENPGHKGFGLESTRHRLELLYKNKATFEIHNLNDNMVEARVNIPL